MAGPRKKFRDFESEIFDCLDAANAAVISQSKKNRGKS
jgi:hypothetical protein